MFKVIVLVFALIAFFGGIMQVKEQDVKRFAGLSAITYWGGLLLSQMFDNTGILIITLIVSIIFIFCYIGESRADSGIYGLIGGGIVGVIDAIQKILTYSGVSHNNWGYAFATVAICYLVCIMIGVIFGLIQKWYSRM